MLLVTLCSLAWLVRAEDPDSVMFSSVAEMAKLAKLELGALDQLRRLSGLLGEALAGDTSTLGHQAEVASQLSNQLGETFGKLPAQSELEGAANGLFLLQETFRLNVSRFSDGVAELPPGVGPGLSYAAAAGLQATDTHFISKIAFNREFYDRAVDWARVSVERARGEESRAYMRQMLGTMERHHDKVLDQRGATGSRSLGTSMSVWRTNPVPFDEKLRRKKKYKKVKEAVFQAELSSQHTPAQTWEHFNRLCAGERLLPADRERHHKCVALHHRDPFLRLGPFKLDVQHINPFIGVFRDMLAEAEMEHYKEFARDRLHRSTVDSKKKTVVTRTSKQTWLDEVKGVNISARGYYGARAAVTVADSVGMRISDRISLATRLYTSSMSGGEPYQIANYGIGGVYNAHPDPFMYLEREMAQEEESRLADSVTRGDRLATFMAYLSSVELGGSTVFPNLGVSIAPEKGSAAFWWNILSNARTDQFTVHGGCPVLVGSKWITNKWIRHKPQELSFPCGRHLRGNTRLPPLDSAYCAQGAGAGAGCSQDRWSRQHEVFFYPGIHFNVVNSINKMI